ncbi:MAG: dihydroorotase [Planctomycetes bacterium]|nr:dihydroorotase [Planctomycetota bacterium]
MGQLLLKNGRVIDPATRTDAVLDILIRDGKVAERGPRLRPPDRRCEVLDLKGLVVAPGLIDVHVHFREPGQTHKETVATGSRAAAMGGFTTVVCEPNTTPPLDSPDSLALFRRCLAKSIVNVYAKACITRASEGEDLTDMARLARLRRVVALSDDGNPVADDKVMAAACGVAAEQDMLISPHCEDSHLSLSRRPSRTPFQNEPRFVSRDLRCAKAAGARLHVSHVSTAKALDAIRTARKRRQKVTCEAAPHHLTLTEAHAAKLGPNGVMNPPLRSADDVAALLDGLRDGTIEVIASDHAPHMAQDKANGAMGVIGLETTLGVVLTRLVQPGILTLPDAIAKLSSNPARIFRLNRGSLAVGMPADITVIDPNKVWTVNANKFESKARNCPFHGWKLTGKAVLTLVGGRLVMRDGRICE